MERTTVYHARPKNDLFFGMQRSHVRNRPRRNDEDDDRIGMVLLGPTKEQKQTIN